MSFENKTFEGIHYSRFIASWNKVKGNTFNYEFREWLRSLTINNRKIPDDVIQEICNLRDNGKLELQEHAKKFSLKKSLKEYLDSI